MNTESLLRSLKENNVDFVIIGATAFPVHGYSRATLDIDIFIKPDKINAQKTWKALKDFGYDVSDIKPDDLLTKKLLIRQYIVETDIHPFVKGASFQKVWKNKVRAKFGHTFACFASLDDLIKMKKAANRPQDRQDLKYLIKLKKLKSNSGGALLFALVTALVLSMVAATLVLLTSNQYRIINNEIERTAAFGRAQAAMEYAVFWAYTNPGSLPSVADGPLDIDAPSELTGTTIRITRMAAGNVSDYEITITSDYQN